MSEKINQTLKCILDYCIKIEESKERFFPSRKKFGEESFYRDGCAFYIQQIGEFVKDLPESFLEENSEIKWHEIKGFRNIIAHAYNSVDADILWETITIDIPQLKSFCQRLL